MIDGASLVGECKVDVVYPTTPLPNATYGPCYGVVFAGEMTKYITEAQKRDFYNLVLQVVQNAPVENLKYAIVTFGSSISNDLNFQEKAKFIDTVTQLKANLPKPDSATTYLQM